MAKAMINDSPYPVRPSPPNLLSQQLSLVPGVYFDSATITQDFGSVILDVGKAVYCREERVQAKFRCFYSSLIDFLLIDFGITPHH